MGMRTIALRVAVTTSGTRRAAASSATTTGTATPTTSSSASSGLTSLSSRCRVLSLALMSGRFFVLFA